MLALLHLSDTVHPLAAHDQRPQLVAHPFAGAEPSPPSLINRKFTMFGRARLVLEGQGEGLWKVTWGWGV